MRLALLVFLFGVHATMRHTMSNEKFVVMVHDKNFLTDYTDSYPTTLCKSRTNGELFFQIKAICGSNKLYPKISDDQIVHMTHLKVKNDEKLNELDIMRMCTNDLPSFGKIHEMSTLDIFQDEKLYYYC
ncbi:unnamed protein product [Caenorhabditis angaria]|uniref:Uncharacterized protein n=1 Tax=Caenorhabditis angaria TaxID=860376 RepID=A0A9P1N739_9PELO|nr:unnamed protein product [Caenorhabditis angaria]